MTEIDDGRGGAAVIALAFDRELAADLGALARPVYRAEAPRRWMLRAGPGNASAAAANRRSS